MPDNFAAHHFTGGMWVETPAGCVRRGGTCRKSPLRPQSGGAFHHPDVSLSCRQYYGAVWTLPSRNNEPTRTLVTAVRAVSGRHSRRDRFLLSAAGITGRSVREGQTARTARLCVATERLFQGRAMYRIIRIMPIVLAAGLCGWPLPSFGLDADSPAASGPELTSPTQSAWPRPAAEHESPIAEQPMKE